MPQLFLDKVKCLRNIENMASKASTNNLSFRPHFKTHQSVEIGNWFREFGVSKITVSSFRMAAIFAKAGWDDILVAFPFNPVETKNLTRLSEKSKISILIDNTETLPFLEQIENEVHFYIDIDTGYGRTGVISENVEQIDSILKGSRNNRQLIFSGFYCHAGHSYKAANQYERDTIHQKAISDLKNLKDQFHEYSPIALYGDTPNCRIQNNFSGIDEITPGNFVFYDLFQYSIGTCKMEEIAVAVACPVAGKYPEDKRIVIHGGAVHFSKESVTVEGKPVYGQLVEQTKNGWIPASGVQYISEISQEHGILKNCGEFFNTTRIGDLICFLPVHSCLTVNLMNGAYHIYDPQSCGFVPFPPG